MSGILSALVELIKTFQKYAYWILLGITAGITLMLNFSGLLAKFTPEQILITEASLWILWPLSILFTAVFGIKHFAKVKKDKLEDQKFSITNPYPHTLYWHVPKQPDGSLNTQINGDVLIRNRTSQPLGLASVRLIKPKLRYKVISNSVLIKNRQTGYSESTAISGARISPGQTGMVNFHLIVAGALKKLPSDKKQIRAKIGISDDDGKEVQLIADFNIG